MLTGSQIRAARGLLRWSAQDLANAAKVGLSTVQRMEGDKGPGRSAAENVEAVQITLEAAGVIFIAENGEGPGVRLRKVKAADSGA